MSAACSNYFDKDWIDDRKELKEESTNNWGLDGARPHWTSVMNVRGGSVRGQCHSRGY
jgi:hypothetical protein